MNKYTFVLIFRNHRKKTEVIVAASYARACWLAFDDERVNKIRLEKVITPDGVEHLTPAHPTSFDQKEV